MRERPQHAFRRGILAKVGERDSVPVLDLSDWGAGGTRARRLEKALRRAFETFGFVSVEGHGVGADGIRSAYALFERFFALDEAARQDCAGVSGGARGFTPFGVEHAKDCALPDLKEFFHVGRELPEGHRRCGQYPPNVWPRALPELAGVALALYDELDRCAGRLLEVLETAYELPPATFTAMLREGNSVLRAVHYPPVPRDVPEGALRAAPHEDINLITPLCEATDSGLEIKTHPGRWLAVEAPPGQIVADAGDMLCRVTGGVIPATTHRVVNPPDAAARDRYSLPFFAHPPPECPLRVLPRFATPERQAAHPPTTAGDYLHERLREIGLE
jgi:isopenicillin N synthase-like dioxygenase